MPFIVSASQKLTRTRENSAPWPLPDALAAFARSPRPDGDQEPRPSNLDKHLTHANGGQRRLKLSAACVTPREVV